MRESKLQKQIIDFCKLHEIYCINIYGSGMTCKGVPDLILCISGKFVAFECKVGKNQLQPDQIIHGQRITDSGGLWFVPRTIEEAIDIIKSVQGGCYGKTIYNSKRE